MSSILNQNTLNTAHAQRMFFIQGYSIYIMVLFAKWDQFPATYLKDVRVEMEKGNPWCVYKIKGLTAVQKQLILKQK
jgi:hypothetical protein